MRDDYVTVSTFLWRDPHRKRDYDITWEHVVILRNMVSRNLTVPHEFVCFCHDLDDVYELNRNQIRTIELDWAKHVNGTCFVRLMLRHPRLAGLVGKRVLNLDVDVCITGNIDHIVNREEENVWWKNPNYDSGGASRAYIQTSIQLLTPGTLTELWEDFHPESTTSWVNRRYGGAEQAWVSERLKWEDCALFTEKHGIYGAMRLFRGKADKGITVIPNNACIVSFPGNRAPWQPELHDEFPFLKEHYR